MQPKNEYGFVIIDTEEKRKVFEPKLPTDEVWKADIGDWRPVTMHFNFFGNGETYRRRISPGEGFEIVPEGEYIIGGVGFTRDGVNWREYCFLCSNTAGYQAQFLGSCLAFRRPIKQSLPAPVEQSTWRPIGDLTGLPESGLVRVGGLNILGEDYDHKENVDKVRQGKCDICITHWQPIAPVPRAARPMTKEEALSEALKATKFEVFRNFIKQGWTAHIEFIKKGGGK